MVNLLLSHPQSNVQHVSCLGKKNHSLYLRVKRKLAWRAQNMDKETNQHKTTNIATTREDNKNGILNNIEQLEQIRKGSAAADRVKRDEWSEGAVSSLLEAYERKWVLRNRAKLKGTDWEDVARHVSSRGSLSSNNNKSPKTQTQCKNKIESMKKRYRSESAATSSSTWPLYSRVHLLLRGAASPPSKMSLPPVAPLPQNSHGHSNGVDVFAKREEEAINKKTLSDHASDKNINNNNNSSTEENLAEAAPVAVAGSESSTSTPAVLYSEKSPGKTPPARGNNRKKRRRRSSPSSGVVAESVRWLAEAVVKSERVRAESTREIEKMRAEAEARRSEMELRRTEIIANTQLEIARIFAGITTNNTNAGDKAVDSSLRIGRN